MYIKKIILVIAIIGLIIAGFFANFVYKTMFINNTAFNNKEAYIYIPTDATYNEVRQQLTPLLKNINNFDALAKQKKYVNNIKAGKYMIKKGMNNNEIINTIRSKNIPVRVLFNNQNSLESLAGRIAQQIEADSISLIQTMRNTNFIAQKGFTAQTALGMYIPNSYEFFWNTSANSFCDKMYTEYKKFWNTNRLQKAQQIKLTPNQVTTLASIVYEESKQISEQPVIAGVYINRLKIGMPLQADPTLKFAAYQLPEYKNTVIKRILNKHKEIQSPYNTYLNKGLPPGPIAMPDISAIDAVLNYSKHQYLYFCADAKKIGYHKFSKTLAQHHANARQYQMYLNKQGINR